jgi:energy-coupling factor transporter ATP-binding protein EcfA2
MKIGAKNFQGITNYQEIEIKKLCLLYGKNSSGKSSILDAIRVGKDLYKEGSSALPGKWMSSIPSTPRGEEDETILLFEEKNVNSFDDWYRSTIKTCFFPQEDFLPLKLLEGPLSDVEKIAIQIKWTSPKSDPRITGYKVFFDGSPVLTWSRGCNRTGKGTIHKSHDFITNVTIFSEDDPWEASSITRSCTRNTSEDFSCNFNIYSFDGAVGFVLDNEEDFLFSKQDDLALFLFMFLISGTSYWLSQALSFNEVPEIRTINNISFSQKDLSSRKYDKSRYHEAILNIYALESELGENKESYKQRIALVNEFLSSEKYLNSGFKVEAELRYHMTQRLIDECREAPPDTIANLLSSLDPEHITTKLTLRDIARNSLVDLDDVGVGISQVMPVIIVAAMGGNAYIQQPELHLHPKMQASIADIFIAALKIEKDYLESPTFILETHSELLALRLLRRICEANRAQLKDHKLELHPDNVSIIYVDKNDKGETTLTELRISESGDFLDRWPDGFFAERDAELFYD